MDLIYHLLGICPDSLTHINIFDILIAIHNKLAVLSAYIKSYLNFNIRIPFIKNH